MRLVFAGTPEVALPSLEALLASEHEVLAVVTRPDAPRGRGRALHPSPVAARAAEAGLEILRPHRPGDTDFAARLSELAPDCCPVVAYGGLVPCRVLDIPARGWVNLHFSLLPSWRGAAPVQHAIMAGDEITGASTFALVEELDAGPVYGTLTEEIGPADDAGALLGRLAESGAVLLRETMDQLAAGTLAPVPQPAEGISHAPKITVADAEINWNRPVHLVDRLIRGCTPAPGAWTTFRGDRFKIISAQPVPTDAATPEEPDTPGELRVDKRSVRVGTAGGFLELGRVQPPGKKAMAAVDWARGVTFTPGEAFAA
ncbi:MAG: methionyl-tRNA formyltransferase [Propionibacteriaceae bacterium]